MRQEASFSRLERYLACRGYKGRVVNATDTHVRMELEAQYKTVTVPRTVLPMADGGVPESANRRPGFNLPRTPGYSAPQTPGYGAANRTPMHAWGSRTPMHPGMTPSHPGSAVRYICLRKDNLLLNVQCYSTLDEPIIASRREEFQNFCQNLPSKAADHLYLIVL